VNYGTGQSVCPQCGSGANVRTVAELFDMLSGGARGGATQQGYPGQQTGPGYQGTYPDYPAQGYQAPSNQDPGNQGPSSQQQSPSDQSPGSTGTSSDQPYQSYQGPGFPSQPYQSPGNQGSGSSGTSSDQPYQSYQGPGFPSQPYQSPSNQGSGSSGTGSSQPNQSYQGPGFPNQPYQGQSSGPAPGYQGPDYPNSQRRGPTIDGVFDDPVQEIAGAVLGAAFKFAGRGIGKRMQKAYEERIAPVIEAKTAQARQQWQPSPDDQAAIVQRYPDLRGCMHDQVLFLEGGSRTVPITDIRMPVTLAQADAIVSRLRAP
jgi:hypothetical protein